MDEQRKLLDQLMGTGRNGEGGGAKHFSDRDVCRFYLVGLCPHELFGNTKADLGPCRKLHAEPLKELYDEAIKSGKTFTYEREAEEFLQRIVDDLERKMVRSQQRIDEQEAREADATRAIDEEIEKLTAKANELGEEGRVEEWKAAQAQVSELKQKRAAIQAAPALIHEDPIASVPPPPVPVPAGMRQQKLRLCVVCGSFLDKNDSDARLADHFGGKLHLGFLAIREKLKELKTRLDLRRAREDDGRRGELGSSGGGGGGQRDNRGEQYRDYKSAGSERGGGDRQYRDRDYYGGSRDGGRGRDYSPSRRGGGGGGDYKRDRGDGRDSRRRSPSPRRY